MWNWLTGGGGSGGSRHRISSFLTSRREFNLASMQQLHAQLLKFNSLQDAEVVELLRVLSEFLIYSDQHRIAESQTPSSPPSLASLEFAPTTASAGVFFDYFCEKNILSLLVQLGQSQPAVTVQIQLLQTLSILVQNIATRTSLYYMLSNNAINRLLECPFAVDRDDDVRDWYVTLLKALSLRLNEETVQFFFDSDHNSFPLYAKALTFGRCAETMVKVAVKTLTLNVFRVQDDRVRRFILEYQDMAYFSDLVEQANELALKIQGLLNTWTSNSADSYGVTDKLDEAIEEYIDHCLYLQDILDVNLPELCYRVGEMLYTRHAKAFLAASVLPDCNPPPQRVSTRLALYLLTRLIAILEHAPLVNAISFMLLCPDASEDCLYSAVALGAGSRRRSFRSRPNTTKRSSAFSHDTTSNGDSIAGKSSGHLFRAHSKELCNSPICYLQTRFSQGEWPIDEVQAFIPQNNNCFRQSILALMESNDELLSSAAMLLLLVIINNDVVDHSLLRELDILPFRHRRHKRGVSSVEELRVSSLVSLTNGMTAVIEESGAEEGEEEGSIETSVVSSVSSSDLSVSSQVEEEEEDTENESRNSPEQEQLKEDREDSELHHRAMSPDGGVCRGVYPHWLVEIVLSLLSRHSDMRFLNVYLCARLLLDMMYDPRAPAHWLLPKHAAILKEIHSISTHHVMESMRGAMADVDLFIYVLEDEFAAFQHAKFPPPLNAKTSSPFEFLVPFDNNTITSDQKATLNLRHPANEMEVCRKSMRMFLTLRRLREIVDEHNTVDHLEKFVTFRHPHTDILDAARIEKDAQYFSSSSLLKTASLDGMVFIKCIWREQRFLPVPAPLCMILNAEALVFVERQEKTTARTSTIEDEHTEGIVRLFAPIHRTYCRIAAKDDCVLHLTISSAEPVEGCRTTQKGNSKKFRLGNLTKWHVSVVFETAEDCKQAKAHIDLCRAEVRAFKLMQIEESLSRHVQITHSNSESPKSKARRLSMDIEEMRREKERQE